MIEIVSPFQHIQNIKVSRQLKKKEIQNFNLNNILIHLLRAYTNQLKKKGLLTNKKIKFHNFIYYEVKNENGAINKIKIKSGNVIEIEEETTEKLTYAIVKTIISHKGNDTNNYLFFYIKWYNEIPGSENNLLGGCSQFKLCDNEKWDVIFPINIVDQQQRVHFVHNCTTIKKLRQQYNLLKSIQEKKDFATKYGISIQPSPFSYLKFNPFQQIPQDAYHAISGKIARLMEITMDLLSESGKKLFIKN
ncbi:hypothetical protein Glove_85g23 [Diversispora epigaea]|uniref:BAH domain-containing protein n=1 Tax=Diversispora epigaea TaxID=1348612 RepID=A0A397J750_9GLOM|nr:hypothetical protein Glove_85g23 [Diversispora epigaea]